MQFWKMPKEIIDRTDLTLSAKVVFACLLDAQKGKGFSFPTVRQIASRCKVSKRTAERSVESLVKAGLLAYEAGKIGTANTYRICGFDTVSRASKVGHIDRQIDVRQNDEPLCVKSMTHSELTTSDKEKTLGRCASNRKPWRELCQHWPKDSDLANSQELRRAWLDHWADRKKKLGKAGIKAIAKRFAAWGLSDTLEAIRFSIENGYTGINRDWVQNRSGGGSAKPRPGDYRSGKTKWDRSVNT